MKKVLIPLAVIFVLGLGTMIFLLSMNYVQVQYQKDAEAHFMAAAEGDVTASYAGQTTIVSADNLGRVWRELTISERKRVFSAPDCDFDTAVVLDFPDGARYAVVPDDAADDAVYICYTDDGKDLWFRVEGYGVMDWMVRAVSPEGLYGTNEVVEP